MLNLILDTLYVVLHDFTLVLVFEAERLILNNFVLQFFCRLSTHLLLFFFASHYLNF